MGFSVYRNFPRQDFLTAQIIFLITVARYIESRFDESHKLFDSLPNFVKSRMHRTFSLMYMWV